MALPNAAAVEFNGRPYLQRLRSLEHAFPALKPFLEKVKNIDVGRQLVQRFYSDTDYRHPGRCYGLRFEADKVTHLGDDTNGFGSPQALGEYFTRHPGGSSRESGQRRLFILEDMEPDYVDILGENLGIDPLVFSEQMNTWNFTESKSIPHRGLPSVSLPSQSFTLRYYEIRTLDDPNSIDPLKFQMTFAVNRRRYERWRDIDMPEIGNGKDRRQAFIRRCASFWTSQEQNSGSGSEGWDAVILVDPGMSTAGSILQDPKTYNDRVSLWNAHTWETPGEVTVVSHKSWAYHDGCPALAPLLFSQISSRAQDQMKAFQQRRNLVSPLDELVFYWTKIASEDLIATTNKESSNAAYYLLKHIAQHWINQLELINCTVAKGEYLSDDYQAKISDTLSGRQWKTDLINLNLTTKDINYLRRQMNYFCGAMVLNLERLGIQLGREEVNKNVSLALQGAQKDFLTIHASLQPLRKRVESLTAIANELANLRAAFKGIQDGEFSLRLSIFASIVFPLTMVASMLSMGDDFLPGKSKFWIFWASSIPFVAAFAIGLVYGKRPDRIVQDATEIIKSNSKQETSKHGNPADFEKDGKQLRRRARTRFSPC